jgi:hypothetical protein
MTYSYQAMGQGFLPGAILSCHVVVGGGALPGDAKSPGLDICGGIDLLSTCVIEFYTECIAFTRICLPYVGIITVCMRVSLVELPFQIVMRWIPALEYILSGAMGSCSHALFCQAVSDTILRGPDAGRAYLVVEAPVRGD